MPTLQHSRKAQPALETIGRASLWAMPFGPVALVSCSALRAGGCDQKLRVNRKILACVDAVVAVEPDTVEAIALEHILDGPHPEAARAPVRLQAGGWEIAGLARIVGGEGSWRGRAPVLLHLEIAQDLVIERALQPTLF